ncbi:P-II family nitrogen regulator [Gloeobacter kilaueensis]|uniref:Nitrogen regulatory protein P-II n=1 Tax=Gloeobacter kilaueensis (strain ATCC BAA-2537 / CCAP 1431/1 / ULC 316 / JS1) TaxID=1183438 RepID=U5QD50_GLOK1|nr:P-II family nitrogen regulator [Gloeobacter kilaueensis]AGY56827.1 nitrogen regulatory protein P-II [Gloeobacter kilaueensis JS1]
MEKIEAIIQPGRLEAVKSALVELGVSGMTVTRVAGFGHQKGSTMSYRGTRYTATFVDKVKIETVVASDMTALVVDVIVRTARTGTIGDGKIFVSPVSRVVRIRTGEQDEAALHSEAAAIG